MATMRWRELGPISLTDLIKFNNKDIEYDNDHIGKSIKAFSFDIYGQLNKNNEMNGIGRANYNDMIYEGQFRNNTWSGYGRCIHDDGRYHIGFFKDDRKSGPGISIRPMKSNDKEDKNNRKWVIEEGTWELDVLKDIKR